MLSLVPIVLDAANAILGEPASVPPEPSPLPFLPPIPKA
jgi:hypothetical protein